MTSAVHLTPRERAILRLIVAGMSNRAIADALGVSEQTVKNQLTVVFEKFHVRTRLQLAVAALRGGLVN